LCPSAGIAAMEFFDRKTVALALNYLLAKGPSARKA
jgi:hypothetical protein